MDNFEAVTGRLMMTHAKLKAIEPGLLSEKRRKERSKRMRELRKAIEDAIALKFGELSEAGKQNAEALDAATTQLLETLSGMQTAIQIIDAISAGLGAIVNLIGLIKT
jgi:hypothetical protein